MATPPEGAGPKPVQDTSLDTASSVELRRGSSTATDHTMTPLPSGGDPLVRMYGKDLEPGVIVGEYRIEKLVGEGGMGRVYSAVHPVIGKRAAVKVLRPELSANAEVVERFVQEARSVNQIGHPNIVDIFSFGVLPDGRSYFVMELLKGESLHTRLHHVGLSRDDLCHHVDAITRALEAAHEQQIVHRDLKPENVFLHDVKGNRPQIKLLDFGIAKLVGNDSQRMAQTRTGAMMGTPRYIAPEQARGYQVDHRVDIYSLGVMMFEMLTGRPPFVADNAMDLISMHLNHHPPAPAAFANVPLVLDRLVVAMMAKDPAQRPSLARVRQVLEEVRALPPGDAALTIPEIGGYAGARPATASRRLIALIAGGVVVAAVGAFAVVRLAGGADDKPTPPPVAEAVTPAPPPIAPTPPAPPPIAPPTPVEPPVVAPSKASLIVTVTAGGEGILTIDGVNHGHGSRWHLELAPGIHAVRLRGRHGSPVNKRVTLVAGERSTLDLALPAQRPVPPVRPTSDDDFLAPEGSGKKP